MNNINEEIKQTIISIIVDILPDAKIYLFGMYGAACPESRIPIAINAGEPLSQFTIDEIKNVIEAQDIVYDVDIVDFQKLSEKERGAIAKEGVVWRA